MARENRRMREERSFGVPTLAAEEIATDLGWVAPAGKGPTMPRDEMTPLGEQMVAGMAAFFMKQLGSVPVMGEAEWRGMDPKPLLRAAHHDKAPAGTVPLALNHPKGEDPAEWPGDLQIQEFPR